MAMAAARARSLYGQKGYRRQSVNNKALGEIRLAPGRQEGVGVAFNRFPELGDRLPKILGDIVVETTEAVAAKANAKAPRRTGLLRESQKIRYSKSKATGQVVTGRIDYKAKDPYKGHPDHEYPFFVEVGTVKTRAQPFLIPALIEERAAFNQRCRDIEKRLR